MLDSSASAAIVFFFKKLDVSCANAFNFECGGMGSSRFEWEENIPSTVESSWTRDIDMEVGS